MKNFLQRWLNAAGPAARRGEKLALALLLLTLGAPGARPQAAEAPAAESIAIGGGAVGWNGWAAQPGATGWSQTTAERRGDPAPAQPHLQSGELETGVYRSPEFTIEKNIIEFYMNGHDGQSGGKHKNFFALKAAADGKVLRRAAPPQSDDFKPVQWNVSNLAGQRVYFEADDGLAGNGYAWIGLAAVRQVQGNPPPIRETVPAAKSPFCVLKLDSVNLGTWGVSPKAANAKQPAPFLNSQAVSEQSTGVVLSPEFTVSTPKIRLALRGWSGRDGSRKASYAELIDKASGQSLRRADPPLTDDPVWTEWDAADLAGKSVQLRLVDDDKSVDFAWIGLDEIDAGPALKGRFDSMAALKGWVAEGSEPTDVELEGIPFRAAGATLFSDAATARVELGGIKAKRLLLLGMSNSIDKGCGIWESPLRLNIRFFVGDKLGAVRVLYADGQSETYPLILGESLWWGVAFKNAPEPFASDPKAQATLAEALNVYPPAPNEQGRYLAAIAPRDAAITALELVDEKAKDGMPVITAVTAEVEPGTAVAGGEAIDHEAPSAQVEKFIAKRTLRPEGQGEAQAEKRLDALRNAFYTTPENFPKADSLKLPEGYAGPRVQFSGDGYADVLSNIFHANVKDILDKIDPDGFYNTSTDKAPTWGGYEGFGTYVENYGAYHGQTWTRDMGRSLGEVTALGMLDTAQKTADNVLFLARAWEEGNRPEFKLKGRIKLDLDGQPLPRHICRRQNYPDTTPGEGCFENDGHGLTTLFIYNLWRRLPNRDQWLKDHWTDVAGLGDWVLWQLDHPELSGAKETLRTDSECAGGTGYSIYADYACIEGLRALSRMAETAGQGEKAAAWRAAADRLTKGCFDSYVIDEKKYGKAWTLKSTGWPNQSTIMGPVILAADRVGFAPGGDLDPAWLPVNMASYKRLTDTYTPFGFYGVAMGYGQGFVTQAALLQDQMKDAEEMLRWTARATYCGAHKPYIVPEGCEVEPGGRFWHRTGDLGNGVQEAEIVKVLRVVIGIDDSDPQGVLKLYPRLPLGWKGTQASDFPVWLERNGQAVKVMVSYTLERTAKGMTLAVKADQPLGEVEVRLGAFAPEAAPEAVTIDGAAVSAEPVQSGDAAWLKIRVPAGKTAFTVEAR